MEIKKCAKSDQPNATQYTLLHNAQKIGYGYIYNREINPIEIFIYPSQQSNGYGKWFFAQLSALAKKQKNQLLTFKISQTNPFFINMIAHSGGKYLSTNNEIETWVI